MWLLVRAGWNYFATKRLEKMQKSGGFESEETEGTSSRRHGGTEGMGIETQKGLFNHGWTWTDTDLGKERLVTKRQGTLSQGIPE